MSINIITYGAFIVKTPNASMPFKIYQGGGVKKVIFKSQVIMNVLYITQIVFHEVKGLLHRADVA